MDEFSDLDFVVICRDEHRPALLREAADLPARLGPLLASFTGEHVGEPWLLIALYGPPLLHVDLKFVADSDLDQRVEDGRVLWQCDGALEMALRRVAPAWPSPKPPVDRGPLLDLDPLRRDQGRPRRAVRVPGSARVPPVGRVRAADRPGPRAPRQRRAPPRATRARPGGRPGGHDWRPFPAGLRVAVDLYRELRDDQGLLRRGAAEAASLDYLTEIEARLAAPDGRSSRS